jgi:hypothetical protein
LAIFPYFWALLPDPETTSLFPKGAFVNKFATGIILLSIAVAFSFNPFTFVGDGAVWITLHSEDFNSTQLVTSSGATSFRRI